VSTTVLAQRIVVTGKVQGVWYRASAVEVAKRLNIQGWARNCRDGSVEMLAVGTPEALEALVAWAHEGPANAVVAGVTVSTIDLPAPLPADFAIAADA